jgi:hypothetical protein
LPDQADTQDLSQEEGITSLGGLDLYYAYISMWFDKDRWWWSYFGADDNYSIWDFFASIAIYETQGNWTDPNLSEAAIRDANNWCNYMYGKPCTTEGYINHFAWEYQSAGNYIGSQLPEPNYENWDEKSLEGMNNFSSNYASHPPDWNEGCSWLRPCGWANKSMYSKSVQNLLAVNQSAVFTYYDPAGNTWIIPSQCVYVSWMGGGGPGAINLSASCPPVR